MSLLKKPLQVSDLKNLQDMWPKDWTLRFISLALAVLLWYFVGGDDTVDKNVLVPVEVINLPRDLVISNQFKREIEVTVSGPRSLVLKIEKGDITRQVDLAHAVPGTIVIKNENHMIPVPRGMQVLRTQPDSMIFSLDKLIQKQLVIKPVTIGEPASHHVLQNITMKPETISITGPQAVLSHLDFLSTQVIDITGLSEPRQIQVPLKLNSELIDLIGETSVTADLVIVEETVEKRISGLPIEMNSYAGMLQIKPATVTIIAMLPRSLAIETKDLRTLFRAIVEDDNEEGRMTVRVVPRQDEDAIKIVKVEPRVVTFSEKNQKLSPALSKPD
jgi:YbbR domain-containing protein